MTSFVKFVTENVDAILAILTGIVTVASMICALTPTAKDDGIVAKLRKVVEFLALNVGNAKKDK